MIKVLQVPFTYHPEPCGGTEIYVEALARELRAIGSIPVIAAPGSGNESYLHKEISVYRFAITHGKQLLKNLYGDGDPEAEKNFKNLLDYVKPDLVHLHAMSPAISIRVVNSIRRKKLPLVYTYHTPTASCQRGSLLKWGSQICNGIMNWEECAPCSLHGRGVPKILALGLSQISNWLEKPLKNTQLQGGFWTALRTKHLVNNRLTQALKFFNSADHIVAVCDWVKQLLLANGIEAHKITLSRQGLCNNFQLATKIYAAKPRGNIEKKEVVNNAGIKMAFLGRLDPTKGPHILIQALKLIPNIPVSLDLYGIAQGEVGLNYLNQLKSLACQDPRIRFLVPIPSDNVVKVLGEYDILTVPSQLLETGPMVVLEAFAAGIPVLGSRLGGIQELVQDGVNGVLVEAAQPNAWARIIHDFSQFPQMLSSLSRGIKPVRTMTMVAKEMKIIYQALLKRN